MKIKYLDELPVKGSALLKVKRIDPVTIFKI
jgi:hypothetical protein